MVLARKSGTVGQARRRIIKSGIFISLALSGIACISGKLRSLLAQEEPRI